MPDRRITCDVDVPKSKRFGVFANAFRVLQDSGPEYLLDFLIYSDSEQSAKVVARLRVLAPMIPAIRNRLGELLKEVPAGDVKEKSPVVFPVLTTTKKPPPGGLH